MKVIREKISLAELTQMSQKMFTKLVKAVVDIEQKIMVIDAGMQADQEYLLLEEYGSKQADLWGINLHPQKFGTNEWVEFDSMINLRPSWGNHSREVDDRKDTTNNNSYCFAIGVP